MEYMGTKEAAEKWGYSQATVCKWCKEGKFQVIVNAEKVSGRWRIPKDAKCPREFKNKLREA